jgi:hypothetical protein
MGQIMQIFEKINFIYDIKIFFYGTQPSN